MGRADKLLKAAEQDLNQTNKANSKSKDGKDALNKTTEPMNDASAEETPQDSSPAKAERSSRKKNPGGRPTNREKGIQSRKQYTLTLKEDTYNLILEKAREDELSFAKFMERAALEYIDRHK